MKRTRNSRHLASVSNAGVNQKCDSDSEKKVSKDDLGLKKTQERNLLGFNYKMIKTNRQSSLPEKKKLNLKNLNMNILAANSDLHEKNKTKVKATVDLEMMKEELKQLEDPPLTQWDKDLMSARLPYSFFDTPCEQLAQNLLGKILVRKLENGTILKGRIVETESYLGVIDKASHTYQNRVSARNLPMYMHPGTIYVYFTYGMYHCFNLSSQEPESRVQIRSVEPLIGLEYMELLLNTQEKEGQKEKIMVENIQHYNAQDLCNQPSKVCTAFNIEKDEFDKKVITRSTELWIEDDLKPKSFIILSFPNLKKRCRYFISESRFLSQNYKSHKCDGTAVLIRALEPLEGLKQMIENRGSKMKSNAKQPKKELKSHELCNGPSKLCMAFSLEKKHSKYSICSWKGLWIEEDTMNKESFKIIYSKRIGIESCGTEWANKPLRYYIYGNKSVSKRDKKAEASSLEKT